jgi:membrane-associated phospholipid phosphatase
MSEGPLRITEILFHFFFPVINVITLNNLRQSKQFTCTMLKKVVFVLLLIPSIVSAQYDTVKRADVVRFADGIIHTYTSPIRWKGKDWAKFGAVIGGTAALTLADKPVRQLWSGASSKALDEINNVGYHYGKPYVGFTLAAGLYASGLLIKNPWARETALMLSTSLVTSGLIEMALKPLVGRARPEKEQGNYEWSFMSKERGFHSFPSGHASMAFTVSFVLAKRVESIPLKMVFYSLAGATTVCRLYSDAHWISDIAFGGVLAWYCSEAVIKRLEANRLRTRPKKTKWDVSPYPGGITLRATF